MTDIVPRAAMSAAGSRSDIARLEGELRDLQAVSDQFRLAVDTIPGLVWTAHPDGFVDFLNQRWLEYTGLTFEQANGWGWRAAVCPDDLPALIAVWAGILASGRPGEVEARLRRFDGEYRWFLFRAVPLYDEGGALVKWYGQTTDIQDRKRAEEELHSQTAHLDELFELAPQAVVLVDARLRIIRVNQEFTRMFGYTAEESLYQHLGDLLMPEEKRAEFEHNARTLSGGQKVESETVRRRKDGVRLAVSMTAAPVMVGAGPIEGYIIYRDITERKRAEALLSGEKRLLEMIARGEALEPTLDAVCRLVEETSSGSVCSVLLLDRETNRLRHGAAPSLPASYTAAIDGRQIGPDEGPCGVAAYTKQPVTVYDARTAAMPDDYRALASAHGLRACASTPILSSDGRVLGTIATYFREPRLPTPQESNTVEQFSSLASIAIERTQAEDALRRSQAYLAEAQRLSLTGSFFWNVPTDEITWSEETYRIFDLDPAVPPSFDLVRQRVHPADLAFFEQTLERATAECKDLGFEHRLQLPDGSVKHLQIVAHASRNAASGGPEYVGAVMDITERKRSEDALDLARSELAHVSRVTTLGQMTASIAHEINQPLAGIVINGNACLRWLAGDSPNIHEASEAARRIVRDGQRAGDVIARLRSLFQRKSPATELLDLNEVVQEIVAITRGEVQKGGVVLRTELADGLPAITGDRVQLQQLVLNLIVNATEAMSDVQGRLRHLVIRTRRGEGDQVVVAVRDSGVGFDPRGGEHLFDAFYTTKTGGMGIGLAIGRSIVENHGGRLWAEANDGPGATFLFTIPGAG